MLIAGDDISNDVITLGTCFSMFVYIRTRFRFTLIGGNLTAQSTRSHRGIGGGIQIPGRDVVTSSRSFSRPRRLSAQESLLAGPGGGLPYETDGDARRKF